MSNPRNDASELAKQREEDSMNAYANYYIKRGQLAPAWHGTEWYGGRIADETSVTMHPTAVYERQKTAKEEA